MMNKHVSTISILKAAPADPAVWDALYDLDPSAMPTQSRVWARAVQAISGSRKIGRQYRFSDGLEAVLPLFGRHIFPFPLTVLNSPPPAWGFGGLLTSSAATPWHLSAILDDCARLPGAAISIRPNPLRGSDWMQAGEAAGWARAPRNAHVLDLAGGFDVVWSTRFSGTARNRIRRAQRQGVVVEIGNSEVLVREFDHLFRLSIDRWARKQNEFRWLARLRGHFRDSSRKFQELTLRAGGLLQIAIARHDDRPVAGVIILTDKNAHYTRGAMDAGHIGKTYANYLLHSTMIAHACARGCRHYHMGETGNSRSLARFKGEFGAVAAPYAEIQFEHLPVFSADRRMRSAIKQLIGFSDA